MKKYSLSFVIILVLNIAFSHYVWSDPITFESDSTTFELDSMEIAKIDSIVSLIPSDSISTFETKYDAWIESTEKPEVQIHSNPEMYKTEEFYDFKEYTVSLGDAYIGLIIDFFLDGHNTGISYHLLLDITYDDYGYLIDDVRSELDSLNLDAATWHNAFPVYYFRSILASIKVSDLMGNQHDSYTFELDSMEIAKIDSIVSLISAESISTFEAKYDAWIVSTEAPELQVHSNPEMFKTEEYYDFKEYTLGLGDVYIGLLIDFFLDGHNTGLSYYLLLEITIDDYGYLDIYARDKLKELNLNAQTWKKAFPVFYFKEILATIQVSDLKQTPVGINNLTLHTRKVSIYPNPAQNIVFIEFKLEKPAAVSITLYNNLGQVMEIIRDEELFYKGNHKISWIKGDNIPPGNYIVSFESGDFIDSKTIIIK